MTGRIREMINRGREKVTPRDVESVLLPHPAVAEAVTFAVPREIWSV
jgi:acyl-CoA synthetase (AMP-forming)/AMP-acid ligase II